MKDHRIEASHEGSCFEPPAEQEIGLDPGDVTTVEE
jgi:hypothetical protein